jgi:AraC-like DNA-binding protein
MLHRAPGPILRPFVTQLWATEEVDLRSGVSARERVLPTGSMHLAFRLSEPLRLFDHDGDPVGRCVGHAVVGGARSSSYLRDTSTPTLSVGAQLKPGVADLLFGVPAGALCERHTKLEELWGRAAEEEALARLEEASDPARRLDILEAMLTARLPRVRGVHPAVALALARFSTATDVPVRTVVEETGYCHRRFITLFRESVGLTPKVYARVLRFQRALARLAAKPSPRTVELALDAGYSDQPHFSREFRDLTGLTPAQYRAASPRWSNHVPILSP